VGKQEAYARLRALKAEVEGMQRLVEQGRQRLQAEFEAWLAGAQAQQPQRPQQLQQPQQSEEEQQEVDGDVTVATRRMSSSLSSSRSLSASTTERKASVERSLSSSSSSSSSSHRVRQFASQATAAFSSPSDVEDDIAAFYRAKEELMAMRRQGREGAAGAW
jgi:hypothetical protein